MDIKERLLKNNTDFSEDELMDIAFEFNGSDTVIDKRRWYEIVHTVIKIEGRYFLLEWNQGLTENQEHQFDNQPYEVERHEKEIITTMVSYTKK